MRRRPVVTGRATRRLPPARKRPPAAGRPPPPKINLGKAALGQVHVEVTLSWLPAASRAALAE
jgi:hypothetical protein